MRSATIGIPLGCLLVLAIVVPEFGGVLIPTMGIVVVAAALFLNPRETMIVAGAAVLTAVAVAFATDTDHKAYRIGNVALASLLGVAGHLMMAHAFSRAEASRLVPIEYTALLYAAIIDFVWFGHAVAPSTLLGAAAIILGALLASRR